LFIFDLVISHKLAMTNAEQILTSSFCELGFSVAFCETCRQMGYGKLQEIMATPPADLVSKPGFNYNWLGELASFLMERGLLHELQPIPGSSGG
jgi:hypothetical protein